MPPRVFLLPAYMPGSGPIPTSWIWPSSRRMYAVPLPVFTPPTSGLTNEEITKAVSSLKISYKFDRPELFSSGGEITLPETVLLPFDEAKTGG